MSAVIPPVKPATLAQGRSVGQPTTMKTAIVKPSRKVSASKVATVATQNAKAIVANADKANAAAYAEGKADATRELLGTFVPVTSDQFDKAIAHCAALAKKPMEKVLSLRSALHATGTDYAKGENPSMSDVQAKAWKTARKAMQSAHTVWVRTQRKAITSAMSRAWSNAKAMSGGIRRNAKGKVSAVRLSARF
jgi:hypothetical protein